jgi:hypothetical protein
MKKRWELFEEYSTKYLNESFQHIEGLIFERGGGTDSTESDIKIILNGNEIFSIESKLSPSQSGQFVIKDTSEKFELSNLNKNDNPHSFEIIDYLNKRYNEYKDVSQNSIEISCSKKTINNWIKYHYKSKKSLFIISSTEVSGYCHVLPIDNFDDYFETKALIRRKKSGSRDIPKSKISEVKNIVKLHLKPLVSSFDFINDYDGNLIVETDVNYSLLNSDRYMPGGLFLSLNEPPSTYKVKMLSKTNNINVIFSIAYIGPRDKGGINLLEEYIKNFKL